MTDPQSARLPVSAQFAALALTWGASFLFIKIALGGMSPVHVAFGRLLLGFLVLSVVCATTRASLPRDRVVWAHLGVVGLLLCALPFTLFAWAEQHISSALASIINATTPLMTMLIAVATLPEERPTRARAAGLATGLLGVVVVLGPWTGLGEADVGGQLACLAATISYGLAFVHLRRFITPRHLPAVSVATIQVGLGAALMTLAVPWAASTPVTLTVPIIAALGALGTLGTGFAYIWNTNVVGAWGATNAATVTYVAPVVGVFLGALVLGERVRWHEPVGAVVVILGILITQGRLRIPRRLGVAPPPPP